jgi:large-conductance mechanosensitive channel
MDQEDKQRNYELAEKLLSEQNLAAAVIVGAVATLLAATIYGIIVAKWNFSYGFAAAGIGIAVGISMQYLGRGIEMKFAVTASVYTIAGCILGNIFGTVMRLPIENAISTFDVFRSHAFSVLSRWSISYVSFIDLVFWFVAVAAAVFLVKRPLSRSEGLAISMYEMKG